MSHIDIDLPQLLPPSGNRHELLTTLRSDARFTDGTSSTQVRDVIEAVYWARWLHPDTDSWEPIITGLGWGYQAHDRWVEVLRADALRHQVPRADSPGCAHILVDGPQRGQQCGKMPVLLRGRVRDPYTGESYFPRWCREHHGAGLAAIAAQQVPGLAWDASRWPNRGGLLPTYLRLLGQSWEGLYAAACPGWVAPTVGIWADLSPMPAGVTSDGTPLSLVAGGAS